MSAVAVGRVPALELSQKFLLVIFSRAPRDDPAICFLADAIDLHEEDAAAIQRELDGLVLEEREHEVEFTRPPDDVDLAGDDLQFLGDGPMQFLYAGHGNVASRTHLGSGHNALLVVKSSQGGVAAMHRSPFRMHLPITSRN